MSSSFAKSLSNNSTTVSFKPVENYQIDGISCKNKISFVKNPIKYSHFLQTINRNLNYKNYFYNKSDYEILATEAPKNIISTIASVNKINLNIKESAIVLVTGSGFITHKIFMQKTQNLLNKLKIKPIYLNLTQTNLTLIISKSKAKILEKSLAIEFNLIKEN